MVLCARSGNGSGTEVSRTANFLKSDAPSGFHTDKRFFVLQNGYPARRRSLVDDARFETLVVKQTKQSVLEEARQRANGKKYKYLHE